MAAPNVNFTIQDGALQLASDNGSHVHAKIGACSGGTANTVYAFTDPKTLEATLGEGPLVEAAALALTESNGPVICVPANQTSAGSAGSVTHVGTGTAVMSKSGAPYDAYSVAVLITKGAANLAAAAAQFQYSLDGGATYSAVLAVPTGGSYAIPKSGLTITFADGTFVANDTYKFTCTAPAFNLTDLTNAVNALLADVRDWFLLHVVGPAATVSAAASMLATVDTLMGTAATGARYAGALIECPSDTDANIIAAFASSNSTRVLVAAGFANVNSALNGRQMSRSIAWLAASRAAAVPPSEDLGRVASGALRNLVSISRDERATPALDAARFVTTTTIVGEPGFYITNPNVMASPGSDYSLLQYRRVMDLGCKASRSALVKKINASLRVNSDGTIDERDARALDAVTESALRVALTQPSDKDGPGYVSAVKATIDRTSNILSSKTVNVKIRIRPKGYAKDIEVDIGFDNPALATTA